jgi:hypothetical protein
MAKLGWTIGRKATKATAKHSLRGVSSKARRKPLRSASLLSIGGAVGVAAGWTAGRKTARSESIPLSVEP